MTTDPRTPETLHPSTRCPECDGEGVLTAPEKLSHALKFSDVVQTCPSCGGTGERKAR